MLRATVLCGLVVSTLVLIFALRVPFNPGRDLQDDDGLLEWSFGNHPNPNNTDHLVFETVHSLLQHWPNTRYRNGHNIVPGIIPRGTTLYYVSSGAAEIPQGLEWVSMDPEHSHVSCTHLPWKSERMCSLLTFVTTRPLKIIYFDGTGAATIPSGTVDTQELFIWGATRGGERSDELPMAWDMCRWGKKFGVDGFVRMEFDFEVILCDFTSGLSLVSIVELKNRSIRLLDPGYIMLEPINAGSWHNHFPGETRIQLDLSGLVSFYDTQLVPSLVPVRVGQERSDHRARGTSSEDAHAARSRLEATLTSSEASSSGIDWRTLVQVIVDRYAGRLELTRHLLDSSATDSNGILDAANKTQVQLRVMLTPHILFSTTPTDPSDKSDLDWAVPVYKLCATTHTPVMDFELDSMTSSEKLLLRAVQGTTREICRVVTKMWAFGVYAGLDQSLNSKASPDIGEVRDVWEMWRIELDRLMAWLDWSVWLKCNPECGPEELCYLDTWLVHVQWRSWPISHPGAQGKGIVDTRSLTPEEWRSPQPRCISRFVSPDN